MKRFLILISLITVAHSLYCQVTLVKDTVLYNDVIVVLKVPEYSKKNARYTYYEEGVFKDYPLYIESRGFLSLHIGYMALITPNGDPELLFSYDIGNIARTKMYKSNDDLYFRFDKYKEHAITISVESIPVEKLKEATDILSTIEIITKSHKEYNAIYTKALRRKNEELKSVEIDKYSN